MPMIIKNGRKYCTSSTLADDVIYDNRNSGLKAGTVGAAIDELAINGVGSGSGGGITVEAGTSHTLLWENTDLTVDFAPQTIALDLSEYDAVDIAYAWARTDVDLIYYSRALIGTRSMLSKIHNHRVVRPFTVSTTGIEFGEGSSAAVGAQCSTNNGTAIPWKIYGVKFIDETDISNLGGGSILNVGEQREMLWQNPSYGSLTSNTAFAAQSIAIPNLTSYKAIEILVTALVDSSGGIYPETTRIDSFLYDMSNVRLNHGHTSHLYHRGITITENEIAFDDGYQESSVANHRMIPIAVFGIKESSDIGSGGLISEGVPFPDYSKSEYVVDASRPESYTVEIDGYYTIIAKQTSAQYAKTLEVFVNGHKVIDLVVGNTSEWGHTNTTLILKEGDVLSFVYSGTDLETLIMRTPFSNSNSGGINFIFNEDGSIKGYTTPLGGADTVFPFKGGNNFVGLEGLTWVRQNSKADKATTTFDLGGKPTYLILMGWDTNQNLLPILEYKNGERKVLYDMNSKESDITVTLTDAGFDFDQNMTSGQLRLFFGYTLDNQPLDNYFYYRGNEYSSLTGGWSIGFNAEGGGTVSFNNNNIDITPSTSGSAGKYVGIVTKKPVDLTNIDTLNIVLDLVTPTDTTHSYFYITDQQLSNPSKLTENIVKLANGSTSGTLDVSGITGSYYIGFNVRAYQEAVNAKIYEIYGE